MSAHFILNLIYMLWSLKYFKKIFHAAVLKERISFSNKFLQLSEMFYVLFKYLISLFKASVLQLCRKLICNATSSYLKA